MVLDIKKLDRIKEEQKKKIGQLISGKKDRVYSDIVIEDVVKIKKGERVLIIANPATSEIAQDLFKCSCEKGALTTLIFQPYVLPPLLACVCHME